MADTARGDMTIESSAGELPTRRVVLLGASNIARSLSIVFDSARNAWGSPLDIVAATGHGRSYGMSSRVLGRTLPGILQSGLNANVTDLAKQYEATMIEPARDWYGVDPIHIKRGHQPHAWQQILRSWNPDQDIARARHSLFRWASLCRIRPQTRHMFGFQQQQAQPARRLSDGSFVSLY